MKSFALALALLGVCGCTRLTCSDAVNSEVRSPDGALVATWFTGNCGATTDYVTTVNLHRPDTGFTDDSGTVFVAEGRYRLDLKWLGAKHLSIECDGCKRKQVFKTVTMLGDIDISFLLPGAEPSNKQ